MILIIYYKMVEHLQQLLLCPDPYRLSTDLSALTQRLARRSFDAEFEALCRRSPEQQT